ncbi:unnamed protein product [Ectocarpus sp. 12 AP-2014]
MEEDMVSLGKVKTKAEADIIPGVFGRDDMTPQECASICEGGGQDGFAVTRGDLCTCFAEADAGIFDDRMGGVCDAPCTGESSQPCGGVAAFDVYRLSLTGGHDRNQLPRHATVTVESTGSTVNDETTTTTGVAPPGHTAGTSTADLSGTTSTTTTTNGNGNDNINIDGYDNDGDNGRSSISTSIGTSSSTSTSSNSFDNNNSNDDDDDDNANGGNNNDSNNGDHDDDAPGPEDSTAGDATAHNDIRQGTVKVKTFVSWWRPRELSLVDASTLRLCKKTRGGGVKSCQDMPLDSSTEVVRVESKHGRPRKDGRFVFRVSTGTPRGLTNTRWELDAGSSADLGKWMSVLEGVKTRNTQKEAEFFGDTPRAGGLGNSFKFSMELGPFTFAPTPAFRGDSISVDDYPLIPGQFLSTAPVVDSANLEVTEVGDLILRQGDLPAYPTDDTPLWAHRVTGSVAGTANGGLGCAVESWWERATNGGQDMGVPVHLAVKNGRWRVGRGWMCTLGRSPRPVGGWRVHLPWDSHGKALKAASLQLRHGSVVMSTEDGHILWSSSPSP